MFLIPFFFFFFNTIAKVSTRNHRRPVCSRSSRNEIVRPHIFVPRNLISRNSRQRKCHAPPRSERWREKYSVYPIPIILRRGIKCDTCIRLFRWTANIAIWYCVDSFRWYSAVFFSAPRENFSHRISVVKEGNGWMTARNTIFVSRDDQELRRYPWPRVVRIFHILLPAKVALKG